MGVDLDPFFPGESIPHADRAIAGGRRDGLIVCGECDAANFALLATHRLQHGRFGDIPQANRAVLAPGRQHQTIGRESDRRHAVGVAGERVAFGTIQQIP